MGKETGHREGQRCMLRSCCVWQKKNTSQDKATSSNEEIKPVALCIAELAEGFSLSVSIDSVK